MSRLRPFQQSFVQRYRSDPDRRFWILGDEMGLGKTCQALKAAQDSPSILVVCPKVTVGSWVREFRTWLGVEPHVLPSAHLGKRHVIVPWSMVAKLAPALRKIKWHTVIVDEVHFAKNPAAKRTRAVLGDWRTIEQRIPGLVDSASRVLCLTGTPIPNRPAELRPVIGAMSRFCHDEFTHRARHRWTWGAHYCAGKLTVVHARTKAGHHVERRVYDDSGASRLDELGAELRAHGLVRRTKEEVLPELPPIQKQVVPIDSELIPFPVQWGERLRMAILGKGSMPPFEQTSAYRLELGLSKVPAAVDHVVEICAEAPDKQLVVFCHHQEVAEQIRDRLLYQNVIADVIHGARSKADRASALAWFDRGGQVLVATIGTMGTGVDGLQHRTDTCVVAELPWVPAELDQAIGRLHRIGQRGSVLAQVLVAPDSMDDCIVDILLDKEHVAYTVLDKEKEHGEGRQEPARPDGGRTGAAGRGAEGDVGGGEAQEEPAGAVQAVPRARRDRAPYQAWPVQGPLPLHPVMMEV